MYKIFSVEDTIQNPAFITPWSFTHFLEGIVVYAWGKSLYPSVSTYHLFIMWMLFHGIYELKDIIIPHFKEGTPFIYMLFLPYVQIILSHLYLKSYYPNVTLLDKLLLISIVYIPLIYIYSTHVKTIKEKVRWANNSVFNTVGDTLFAIIGFYIGYVFIKFGNNTVSILLTLLYMWIFKKFMSYD